MLKEWISLHGMVVSRAGNRVSASSESSGRENRAACSMPSGFVLP